MSNPKAGSKLAAVASDAKHRVSGKLSDLWWWFLIRGVLALGLSVCALFWPQQTVGLLIKLLGGYLLLDGLLGAISTFRSGDKRGAPVVAIVGLVVGMALLFWTGLSIRLFLILVGAWALIQGIGMFLSSRNKEADPESRNLVGIVGGVLAIAGLILILWPSTGVVTVSWLIAAISLLLGCLLIFVATRLRRVARRLQQAGSGAAE